MQIFSARLILTILIWPNILGLCAWYLQNVQMKRALDFSVQSVEHGCIINSKNLKVVPPIPMSSCRLLAHLQNCSADL